MADKKGIPYPRKSKTDWKNKTPEEQDFFERKKRGQLSKEERRWDNMTPTEQRKWLAGKTGGMDFPPSPTRAPKVKKTKTGLGTSTTIKRMTGGVGHKKIKGTSVEDIAKMREDWEVAPMEGTPGPYNPQKMRLKKKKKKDASVKIEELSTSRKQAMSAAERRELIGLGVNPAEIAGTVEHKKWQREKKRAAEQTPPTQAKTGGTVKRKSGGTLGTGSALRGFGRGYKKGGTI
jgi:hypothetical protein